MNAKRKRKVTEEESICMAVRIQVWLSAYVHAHDWNHRLLRQSMDAWMELLFGVTDC